MGVTYTFNESKRLFAYNLKFLMEENKFTIKPLSEKTGFPMITIKKWRAGERIPTFDSLKVLAEAFNTTIQKLYLPYSYYEKKLTKKFKDFIDHKIEIGQTDYALLIELVNYNQYLIQKMLFSFLTPKELDDLKSIYRYYIITKEGQEQLDIPSDAVFETFYNKSKKYILDKYGPSLPYTIQIKEQMELNNAFRRFIKIKYVGSQAYELMKGVTESMAGRVSIIRMSPLSSSEIYGKEELKFDIDPVKNQERISNYRISVDELYKLIVRGMYPELYDKLDINTESFYSNYVDTYIEREVSQLINVKDKMKFQNFMEILASLTGQELVYDTIAKAVGVKVNTIQSWVSVLIACEIIYLLQPYNELSIVKRIVKRPKIYFNDTGLACYLARLNNEEVLKKSIFAGRFIETYIVNEIKKSYRNNGLKENFYYYRDNNQNEIDLIILENGTLHYVECKSGISFNKSDIKSFRQLDDTKYKKGSSCIICNTDSIYTIDEDVFALPITII